MTSSSNPFHHIGLHKDSQFVINFRDRTNSLRDKGGAGRELYLGTENNSEFIRPTLITPLNSGTSIDTRFVWKIRRNIMSNNEPNDYLKYNETFRLWNDETRRFAKCGPGGLDVGHMCNLTDLYNDNGWPEFKFQKEGDLTNSTDFVQKGVRCRLWSNNWNSNTIDDKYIGAGWQAALQANLGIYRTLIVNTSSNSSVFNNSDDTYTVVITNTNGTNWTLANVATLDRRNHGDGINNPFVQVSEFNNNGQILNYFPVFGGDFNRTLYDSRNNTLKIINGTTGEVTLTPLSPRNNVLIQLPDTKRLGADDNKIVHYDNAFEDTSYRNRWRITETGVIISLRHPSFHLRSTNQGTLVLSDTSPVQSWFTYTDNRVVNNVGGHLENNNGSLSVRPYSLATPGVFRFLDATGNIVTTDSAFTQIRIVHNSADMYLHLDDAIVSVKPYDGSNNQLWKVFANGTIQSMSGRIMDSNGNNLYMSQSTGQTDINIYQIFKTDLRSGTLNKIVHDFSGRYIKVGQDNKLELTSTVSEGIGPFQLLTSRPRFNLYDTNFSPIIIRDTGTVKYLTDSGDGRDVTLETTYNGEDKHLWKIQNQMIKSKLGRALDTSGTGIYTSTNQGNTPANNNRRWITEFGSMRLMSMLDSSEKFVRISSNKLVIANEPNNAIVLDISMSLPVSDSRCEGFSNMERRPSILSIVIILLFVILFVVVIRQ